jgi:folate-binding protein YgfZ
MNTFLEIKDHQLLLLKGPDAQKFLQGQVTCDIMQLAISNSASKSILGAHCTHKGRMLFSFLACQTDEHTVALSIHAPLLVDAHAQLKKYSIFSKVELINASKSHRIIGYKGKDLAPLKALGLAVPHLVGEATHSASGITLIKLDDERFELWVAAIDVQPIGAFVSLASGDEQWCIDNIKQGIAEVRTETVEAFIPQMLNFQVLREAISFTKGCYTGQEVVARMHYLGKLKKHLYHFSVDANIPLLPNTPLYTPDKKQAIGHVALSAPTKNGQILLAVVTEESVIGDKVFVDQNYQQKLQAQPLPYAIAKASI